MREVLEETGIQTTFISLVCFRHMLNFRFGCSDIYFICLLKPLTHEITRDTKEIADAQWMEVITSCKNTVAHLNILLSSLLSLLSNYT